MASYWLAEPAEPLRSRPLDGPAEVEVVGGGFTGCSCALTLARRGLRVRLHEAREIGSGASGRNGGFALRGGTQAYDAAREHLGGSARDYWRLTESYLDHLAELGGEAVRRLGSLRLAADDEEREEIRREYEALREDGFGVEWRDALDDPLTERFTGAIFHPRDAAIQPARVVRRLAARAAEEGAEIREQSRVESLDALEAPRVVVATDGYPSGLLGALEGLIIPTRGQMIATEPIPERLFEIPHYGRHGFDYWHQPPDGRILAGGFRDASFETEFTDEEATTPIVMGALESFVSDLVGRPVAVERRWAGIFGLVPDLMPVVGRLPHDDRIWVAGGYSGHGNVLGFACGDLVARALQREEHPLLPLFDPARLLA